MKLAYFFFLAIVFSVTHNGFSQRSKDGSQTYTTSNTIVNTYTSLTADVSAGATSLTVANNALNGAIFSGNLAQGDLVMIVQMQGVIHYFNTPTSFSINVDWYPPSIPANVSCGIYNVGGLNYENGEIYGVVKDYQNSGNYELREVLSVSGSNTINLTCSLEKNYIAAGHVQVIRVPRFNDLTIQSGASITCPSWDGSTGGVVAIEVNGNLNVNTSNAINVSGRGFRGGVAAGQSLTGSSSPHAFGDGNGSTFLGSNTITEGAEIGEGIFGYASNEYAAYFTRYGRGALANGGGGGGYQNAGGGGGANIGDTNGHTGKGIPTSGYATYWNAEKANMATTLSSGGGRGGYSLATSAQNPSIGPNLSAWSGDARKENGGYGGHALVYNPLKIFMGGGGGAGGQDSGQGGSGGSGGGIIHLTVYGTVSGTGSFVANGNNGQNSNPNNENPAFNGRKGNDGAGGAGAGGYIYVKSMNAIPSTISLSANGGIGGSFALRVGTFGGSNELCGPGAGGAGGGIAYTSGTPTTSVVGGLPGGSTHNGSQNSMSTQFPMNGATSGGTGMSNLAAPVFDIIAGNDTICGSQSGTLTATVNGTFPSGSTIGWYTAPFGGSPVATGTTFNTPTLSSTTTYYVGNCPGTFRKPVTVVVGSNPVISGTANITDATCTTGGSITGLSASGGTNPLVYSWNGTITPDSSLTNASAGNYTLTVTDQNGCTAQSGPHTINGVGGPSISGTPVITQETCTTGGSITGLTVSGGVGTITYEWNGNPYPSTNLTDTTAGSYTLVVTDANGCTAQSGPHTITHVAYPVISGTPVVTNENCNNGGAITGLTAGNGLAPYQYSWNGVSYPTANLTDTTAGSYTLVVTDANGCTAQSGPHTIGTDSNPVIGGTAIITDATCSTGGSINGLTVSGGVGTITYEWNNTPSTSADTLNAPVGTYELVVTDANGCTDTSNQYTINLTGGPSISGTPVVSNVTCSSQGSITGLTVSGGTAPYVYSWNTNPSSTPNLSGASVGTYTLYVSDASGCVNQSGPYTIGQEAPPVLGGTPVITDVTCSQGGSITGITVSGGEQPYVYEWNGTVTTTADLMNASAGSYTLTVTDANGCELTSGPHTIGSGNTPSITGVATVTDATCLIGGAISNLSVTGGTAPYTYSWNGINSPFADVSDLTPGTYTLVVEDANGCTDTSSQYTINAPDLPVINGSATVLNANCLNGGSITGETVSGGTTPYSYDWNSGMYTTLDISNLTTGNYVLTVSDANGCTATGNQYIVGEDVFVDAQFVYTPVSVVINEPVQFDDQSAGNIVSWTWLIESDTINTQNASYTYTQDGLYNVTLIVVDANGCIDTATTTIEVLSDLVVPNVITINGDGVNDFFVLKGLIPNTKIIILNRWGELVYTSDNYDNTWGGRDLSGRILSEGVYTYVVTQPDGNRKHGFIHLVH